MLDQTTEAEAVHGCSATVVELAKSVQEERYYLVPCNGKAPIGSSWNKREIYEANQDAVIDHIARGGSAGIIMTPGLMAFDADCLEAYEWAIENLPDTPMRTITSRDADGRTIKAHLYYQVGAGVKEKSDNRGGKLDLKLTGQCLAFGPHVNGGFYDLHFPEGCNQDALPIFTEYHLGLVAERFPKFPNEPALNGFTAPQESRKDLIWQMLKGEVRPGEGVQEGGRNDALNSFLFQAAKRGANKNEITRLAFEFCANCVPVYDDREQILKTIESAYNKGFADLMLEAREADAALAARPGAYTWDDVVAAPDIMEDYDWVIPGLIETGLTAIGAYAGAGKSYTMGALSAHVAGVLPESMIDSKLTPKFPRNVVIVSEAPLQLMRMFMVMAKHYGLDYKKDFEPRIKLIQARRQIAQHLKENAALFETFTRETIVNGVIVTKKPWIIYDTSSATVEVDDENGNSEWSRVADVLKNSYVSMPVCFVCHVAKTLKNASDGSSMSMRGAGSIEGDAHQTFYLTIDEKTKERRVDFQAGKVRFTLEHDFIAISTSSEKLDFIDEAGDTITRELLFPILEAKTKEQVAAEKAEIEDSISNMKTLQHERNLLLVCQAVEKHQFSDNLAPLSVSTLRENLEMLHGMNNNRQISGFIEELIGRGALMKAAISNDERAAFNEARSQQLTHQTKQILEVSEGWMELIYV